MAWSDGAAHSRTATMTMHTLHPDPGARAIVRGPAAVWDSTPQR